MIKTAVLILFVLMMISLGYGFYFLMKDQGAQQPKRLLTSLIFRATLAVLILLLLSIGFYTGELHNQAPW